MNFGDLSVYLVVLKGLIISCNINTLIAGRVEMNLVEFQIVPAQNYYTLGEIHLETYFEFSKGSLERDEGYKNHANKHAANIDTAADAIPVGPLVKLFSISGFPNAGPAFEFSALVELFKLAGAASIAAISPAGTSFSISALMQLNAV